MAVARSSYSGVAICYVVPVLWTTSFVRVRSGSYGGLSIALQRVTSLRRRAQASAAVSSCPIDQTWNWVIGSPGQWVFWVIFHVRVTGSSFWPCVTRVFPVFEKMPNVQNVHLKCWKWQKCLLLDWNHWMSVHAMNFYFYLWLLKILWPENTFSHISRHLEFILEQGQLGLRVAGFPGHSLAGSQNVTQFHLCYRPRRAARL